MGIFDFLSSVATNFRNHYLELANNPAVHREPRYTVEPLSDNDETSPETGDRYEPSSELGTRTAPAEIDDPVLSNTGDPIKTADDEPALDDSDETAIGQVPQQPYRFRRVSNFNYEVRLEFQLRAIAQIAQEIADGEAVSAEEFAAAGFGLSADMNFRGASLNEAYGSDVAAGEQRNGASMLKARNTAAFTAQSRTFAMESFSRESLKIKKTMNANSSEHYQRAVNKFSLRYRSDDQFSFAFLNRFNVQTQQVAESQPGHVESYVDSAGSVAERGSSEMMAVFFDAVDAYLEQTEDALLARAAEFFDLAAAELGLSDQVLSAKDHLIGTIESFFNRVNEAVDALESSFVSPAPELPLPEEGIVGPNTIDYYAPSVSERSRQVAIA